MPSLLTGREVLLTRRDPVLKMASKCSFTLFVNCAFSAIFALSRTRLSEFHGLLMYRHSVPILTRPRETANGLFCRYFSWALGKTRDLFQNSARPPAHQGGGSRGASRALLDSQRFPQGIHLLHHLLAHANGPAPLAVGFPRPLVGGIESDLGTQPGHR